MRIQKPSAEASVIVFPTFAVLLSYSNSGNAFGLTNFASFARLSGKGVSLLEALPSNNAGSNDSVSLTHTTTEDDMTASTTTPAWDVLMSAAQAVTVAASRSGMASVMVPKNIQPSVTGKQSIASSISENNTTRSIPSTFVTSTIALKDTDTRPSELALVHNPQPRHYDGWGEVKPGDAPQGAYHVPHQNNSVPASTPSSPARLLGDPVDWETAYPCKWDGTDACACDDPEKRSVFYASETKNELAYIYSCPEAVDKVTGKYVGSWQHYYSFDHKPEPEIYVSGRVVCPDELSCTPIPKPESKDAAIRCEHYLGHLCFFMDRYEIFGKNVDRWVMGEQGGRIRDQIVSCSFFGYSGTSKFSPPISEGWEWREVFDMGPLAKECVAKVVREAFPGKKTGSCFEPLVWTKSIYKRDPNRPDGDKWWHDILQILDSE